MEFLSQFIFWIVHYRYIERQLCNCVLFADLVTCNFAEFISFSSFLVDSLEFSTYKIILNAYKDSFTSSPI